MPPPEGVATGGRTAAGSPRRTAAWVGGALGLDYPLVKEGLGNLIWYDSRTGYYCCALSLFLLIFGIVRLMERHRCRNTPGRSGAGWAPGRT